MRRRWLVAAGVALPTLVAGIACNPGRSAADAGPITPPPRAPAEEASVTDARPAPEAPWPAGSPDEGLAVGERQLYSRDNLSDYINGGAAFYLAYSFEWLAVWEITTPLEGRAVVEVYGFGSAEDALGVALDRGALGELAGFERGVARRGGLRAQKGATFVRVATPDRSEKGDALARRIGGLVAAGLPAATTELPAVCAALPDAGMRPDSLRFFHTRESLDSLYYLGDENLLALSAETRCALAGYDVGLEGKAHATLLLVVYPSAEAARGAFETLCRRYLESEPPRGREAGAQLEDGTHVAAAWSETTAALALALGAREAEWAQAVARETLDAYREGQQ